MVRSGIFLFVLFVFFLWPKPGAHPSALNQQKKKQGSLMQGTERENKLPEPWYGLKNWVITTHPPTKRSIRRDFIENKKTNYENWFWKIWHGVLFVHSFPGLCAWNLSLLKISFIRFNGCFLFLFLFSLFLITVFICLFKERKSELGRGFGAISNYWIEPPGSSKCNGNEILWGSGENSSIWMIIQCNYLYQSPSLTMFDL